MSLQPAGTPIDADAPWLWLVGLVALAVVVFWFGSRRFQRDRGASALEPRGRRLRGAEGPREDPHWLRTLSRLEREDPTPIASLAGGPVRVRGELIRSDGNLGGPPGAECVYRNRVDAPVHAAIAAELVIVADATGRVGVENLERARVVAPAERRSHHRESISLRLGDRVEVFGDFVDDRVVDPDQPTQTVYGTIGGRGPLEVRLIDRGSNRSATDADSQPDPPGAPP